MSLRRNCSEPSPEMNRNATESWRQFHVLPSGGSCCAQVEDELVQFLTGGGHRRASNPQCCDYYIALCPISSRIGTDITEAERSIPGDKPALLLVLHPSFDPNLVFRPSSALVQKPNVVLTVDLIFHQGALLNCYKNNKAWAELSYFIWGYGSPWRSWRRRFFETGLCVGVAIATAAAIYFLVTALTSAP